MPEGPEIRYLSELCKTHLHGCELINIISNSKNIVNLPKKSKLIDVISKGKLLVMIFEDYYFHIHFGLTGWIVFDEPKYPKYELTFEKNNKEIKIFIDDSRRFSKLQFLDKDKHNKTLNKLGIDIFSSDFTLEYFSEQIKKVNKRIVSFLLEQNKFCGIGNYIKNESLYIAKINPYSNTSDINDKKIHDLYNAIKLCAFSNYVELMKDLNIDKKELKRFKKEVKLEVPYKYKVYQNEIDPHGNKVIKKEIAGRQTFYVKEIQI